MIVVASIEKLNNMAQLIADAYVKKMTGKADQSNIPVNENEHISNGSTILYHNKKEN